MSKINSEGSHEELSENLINESDKLNLSNEIELDSLLVMQN